MDNDSLSSISNSSIQKLLAQDPSTYSEQNISDLLTALTGVQLDLMTRVKIGECLSIAGDPRILTPDRADYWTLVTRKGISLNVGRYMVTTAEWRKFIDSDEYTNDSNWSELGIQWRDSDRPSWSDLGLWRRCRTI